MAAGNWKHSKVTLDLLNSKRKFRHDVPCVTITDTHCKCLCYFQFIEKFVGVVYEKMDIWSKQGNASISNKDEHQQKCHERLDQTYLGGVVFLIDD